MQIDVSIIIPIYNVENYLSQCIDSVIEQSNCNTEIILIDDCSTDKSYEIAQKYTRKFEHIRLFRKKENKKVGAARNLGIENSKGKYILFVDSDDYLKPDSIWKLFIEAEEENLDILFSTYWKDKNHQITKRNLDDTQNTINSGLEFMNAVKFLDILVWNKLWKRSFLIENNLSFVEHGFEDVLFVAEAINKAKRVGTIDFPFYYYRIRENSTMTKSVSKNTVISHYKMILKLEKLYTQNQSNIASNQYLKLFLYSFATFDGFINRFQPNSEEEKRLKNDMLKNTKEKYLQYQNQIFGCTKLGLIQKIALYISPSLLRILFEFKHQ